MPPNEDETTSGEGEAVKESQEIVEPALEQDSTESDEINSLKGQLSELSERLQKQSALIGKLTNEAKREKHTTGPSSEQPKGEVSEYQELRQQLDSFQARFDRQERAAKLNAIELSLVEAGASPALAKEQSEYFAFKLGDRLASSEDSAGKLNVQVIDTDGVTPVPVGDWAKALLGSDSGAYLRAQKRGPSTNNVGEAATPSSKVKLNQVEYSKQLAQARGRGQKAVDAFVASHSIE